MQFSRTYVNFIKATFKINKSFEKKSESKVGNVHIE